MKKISIIIFVLLVLFPLGTIRAEDKKRENNFKIGVELGIDNFFGSSIGAERVRKNRFDYDPYCGIYYSSQTMAITYVGIKSEYFFLQNRIGVAAGFRVSNYSTSLNSEKDYFLWLLQQDQLTTDYARIHDITQNSYYVGIPLEFRFFPNHRELPFQHYFKLGTVFNYRLSTNNVVNFQNASMNHLSKTVEDQIDQPQDFSVYIYPVIGFKIAKYPWFNVEFHFPCGMFNDKGSSFIQTSAGLGVQFSVQIPLGKSYPMGSE
jgi:hypothetical protein